MAMADQMAVALDLDTVKDYIEEALTDQTLSDAEREVVLRLRQVPERVRSFADFDADVLRFDPALLAEIEQTERHLYVREDDLHVAASKLRAMASELHALAEVLPRERDELDTTARRLHAMADRTQEEWEVLHTEWCALRAQEAELHPKALLYHVFRELYGALCRHEARYAPEVAALPTNARRLVEAVSRYVAHRGFAPAAVTAVAATVLWLIDKIGQEAFCRFYTPLFAAAGRDGAGT